MPETKSTSPDGRFVITVDSWEARMSLWVDTPELYDTLSSEPLIHFTNTNWSLDEAVWQSNSVVEMTLRKYPGNHDPADFAATVDCEHRTAVVCGVPVGNLRDVEQALEREVGARKKL